MNTTSTFARCSTIAALLALGSAGAYAQPANFTNTVTYKHNRYIGQDASVWELHNGPNYCIPTGQTVSPAYQNFGNDKVGSFMAWTWAAAGCPTGTTRFFIRFPQLSLLAAHPVTTHSITITSAILKLHGVNAADLMGSFGNSTYPGSPYPGDNRGKLYKVAAGSANAWREDNITWVNSLGLVMDPNIAAVPIPPTTSRYNFTQSFNVTAMVSRIIRDASGYFNGTTWVPPSAYANNGFMLLIDDETAYRSQFYATSDHNNPAMWPELSVTYSVESRCKTLSDPSFNYTTSNTDPLTFTFNANSPTFPTGYKWYAVPAPGLIDFSMPIGTGTPFTYTFPAPGVYNIAMGTMCEDDQLANMATVTISLANGVTQSPQKAASQPDGAMQVSDMDNNNRVLPGDEPASLLLNGPSVSATPNPTDDNWAISLDARAAVATQVTLYNASGKKISETTRQLHTGRNRFELAAKALPPGLYLLTIRGGSLNLQHKLIKR